MFPKNDKRRLYQLMDMYLGGVINGWTFCDEFYYSYSLEIMDDDLSDREQFAFSQLSKITYRYTNIQEDLIKYPATYYDDNALKQKIIETIEYLNR